jgi:hypothetical protein
MAVLPHSGLRIAASMTRVTHAWPRPIEAGGCSLLRWFGTTHDTAGSVPAAASAK